MNEPTIQHHLLFKSSNQVTAFLTIQEGCDKFCPFCVVPYTRGADMMTKVEEIRQEVKEEYK